MSTREEIPPQVLPHRDCAGRLGYIVVQKRSGLPEMAKAMPAGLAGEDMAVYDMPVSAERRLLQVSSDIRNSFAVFPVITYIGEECPIIWDGKEYFAAGEPNLNNPVDCVFNSGPRHGEPYTSADHYEAQLRWGMAPYLSIELDTFDNYRVVALIRKGQDQPKFRVGWRMLYDREECKELITMMKALGSMLAIRVEVSKAIDGIFASD